MTWEYRGFLEPMFLLFRKAFLLYKTSKIFFSRFIFTIYDMRIEGVTKGYRGLQRVTRGYTGLQGVTGGDKRLQGVTKDYRNFFLARKEYRNFFLTRMIPDTFSWSILHQNQS